LKQMAMERRYEQRIFWGRIGSGTTALPTWPRLLMLRLWVKFTPAQDGVKRFPSAFLLTSVKGVRDRRSSVQTMKSRVAGYSVQRKESGRNRSLVNEILLKELMIGHGDRTPYALPVSRLIHPELTKQP